MQMIYFQVKENKIKITVGNNFSDPSYWTLDKPTNI